MPVRHLLAIAWVAGGPWACSGADPAEPTPMPFLPANTYCEQTAEFMCAFYLRCGWMAAASQAECVGRFQDSCEGRWEPLYVALAEARLVALSSAGVQACAAHLQQVACEEQATELAGPCRGMWEGLQPVGGPCGMGAGGLESMVCAPNSRCVLDLTFCGTCTATKAVGETCALDSECEPSAACIDERCQPRVLPGGRCGATAPCVSEANCEIDVCVLRHVKQPATGSCQSQLDCQYALGCVGGTCQPSAPLGESCDAASPCDAGRCVAGRCAPLLAFGDDCQAHGDCLSGGCSGGHCTEVPGSCLIP